MTNAVPTPAVETGDLIRFTYTEEYAKIYGVPFFERKATESSEAGWERLDAVQRNGAMPSGWELSSVGYFDVHTDYVTKVEVVGKI